MTTIAKWGATLALPALLLGAGLPASAHGNSATPNTHANAAYSASAGQYLSAANLGPNRDNNNKNASQNWWTEFMNWFSSRRANAAGNGTTTTATSSNAFSISGIDGPTSLAVNTNGTWTVDVKNAPASGLNYSVAWGDEGAAPMMAAMNANQRVSSSATFTHAYATAGTYTATFTVTNPKNGRALTKDETVTVTDVAPGVATLDSINPASGQVGTTVSLTGSGFTGATKITIGGQKVGTSTVTDDRDATFVVPSLATGTYNVRIVNANGRSNAEAFTVTASAPALSIEGIDAPTTLAVNVDGTWTVHAASTGGNLHYRVNWGDEPTGLMALFARSDVTTQSSSTFTHAYATAGTYTPTFTISDDSGHSETASASVVVK